MFPAVPPYSRRRSGTMKATLRMWIWSGRMCFLNWSGNTMMVSYASDPHTRIVIAAKYKRALPVQTGGSRRRAGLTAPARARQHGSLQELKIRTGRTPSFGGPRRAPPGKVRVMPGNENVIPLQAHPRARARDESAAALDVVSQIFEQVGADASLPGAVRAEIARLRIATLRAVQLVPGFLVQRMHPARRLLDTIGSVAVGLDEAALPEDATVHAIAIATRVVLNDFDADPAPFDNAAAALEEFLVQRTREEDEAARPMIQAIVQRETSDLPRRAAQEEVERRLGARLWVPSPVRAMLRGPWVAALAVEYRKHGEGSAAWHARVRTMDELLWSVEPKASAEGRRRLAAVLPELVESITEGLQLAQLPAEERDAFLSSLVDCHAQAMKAGQRGLVLVPEAGPAEPRSSAFAAETYDAGARRVEEIRLATAPTAAPDSHDEAVARLRTGAWIEIQRGARMGACKRLVWSSPITGALLFAGLAPASIGVSILPSALAEKMRSAEARILDTSPLVERLLLALAAAPKPQG